MFIVDPATITFPSGNVTVEADLGTELSLTCNATGVPAPVITWSPTNPKVSLTSVTIINSEKLYITSSTFNLISVQLTDNEYTCTGNNSGGVQSLVFSIIVSCKFEQCLI